MTDNLIHLLEAAEGPSRELDLAIEGELRPGQLIQWDFPHYTASLDAAVSLVPEGWEGQVNVNGEGGCWIDPPAGSPKEKVYGQGRIYAHAATNPLALCIAALKAREA